MTDDLKRMETAVWFFRRAADDEAKLQMLRAYGHAGPYRDEPYLRDSYKDAVADFAEAAFETIKRLSPSPNPPL